MYYYEHTSNNKRIVNKKTESSSEMYDKIKQTCTFHNLMIFKKLS